MNPDLIRKASELAQRAYTIEVTPDKTTDGEAAYTAYVVELDGCLGQGATAEEAEADVRLAMVDYIASLIEDGLPVPEPQRGGITATQGTAILLDFPQVHSISQYEAPTRQHAGNLILVPLRS